MDSKDEFASGVTEFPRSSSVDDEKSSFGFLGFSKLFSFGRGSEGPDPAELAAEEKLNSAENEEASASDSFSSRVDEGRSLPNVLKRISNLAAVGEGLTSYKNTSLKQYWMPDSFSNECYDCGEKFTTFRRRHHCRVCGQIFCSRCCNQKIPGKIMGCTGDLRVCTYCCKVVLSYLESADMTADLSADLRALQEDLQVKLGRGFDQQQRPGSATVADEPAAKRKPSVGYQEERFALGKAPSCTILSDEERCQALQNSASLRGLFEEILHPTSGVALQVFLNRHRDIPECLTGSDLVDWLIDNSKAATRVQALAMGQMLLEAGYVESTTELSFTDGDAAYRVVSNLVSPPLLPVDTGWGPAADSGSERMSEGDDGGLTQSTSSYLLDMNVEDRVVHITRPSPPPVDAPPTNAARSSRPKKASVAQEVDSEGSVFLEAPTQPDSTEVVLKSGWHKADNLVRPLYGEAAAYRRLTSAFEAYEAGLLRQLLTSAGLSHSWAEIIAPMARNVVDQIRPDYRLNDEMDIRQYVQVKKLAGGNVDEIRIVEGVVCSKNVTHRAMRSRVENPRILLLRCAVVYQRVEGRMLSLEPVMMQEHEYLRHVVARIASMKPDVVLVHKNVSRLAQESLLVLGITLVLNVKLSVLGRVARLTGAEIVKSVDAQVGKPQLGTCKTFFLETFPLQNGTKKTLMFFDGGPKPDACCTILLRGGPATELTKLKKIMSFLVLSEYNWRLEKSFLMDEFARPPSPPAELFQDSPSGSPIHDGLNPRILTNHISLCGRVPLKTFSSTPNKSSENCDFVKQSEYLKIGTEFGQGDPEKNVESAMREAHTPKINESNKVKIHSENRKEISSSLQLLEAANTSSTLAAVDHNSSMQSESVSDQSDPLQAQWSAPMDTVQLAVAELPRGNKFRTALDDTVLSISPFLKLTVPYLESDIGRNCSLRAYFPEDIFYSKQFLKQEKEVRLVKVENLKVIPSFLQPKHEFLTSMFTDDASNVNVQTLLALYRANGGQIPLGAKGEVRNEQAVVEAPKPRDVLDPFLHQQFSVLFCSYSGHSENAPAFCVDPWVVTMTSYGPNDIPLGCFLENYCFRPTDNCPSQTCSVAMQQHSRRFVHDAGAICLTLNTLPKNLDSDQIWLWNWCFHCRLASPMVPMSDDTWSLSFAKYLELRFLGEAYTRRGVDDCRHSLHHEHFQYFAKENLVAAFKFIPIRVRWEISLPPRLITLALPPNAHAAAVDELRGLAIKGHDVFSTILEYLLGLDYISDEEIQALKILQQKDQAFFKSRIEEIQFRLTSPTLESKRFEPGIAAHETETLLWRIEDSIVALKRHICEAVMGWNCRFMDCKRKEDRSKRSSDGNIKAQVSPPQSDDGRSKDEEEVNSACDTEDESVPVWGRFCDSLDVPDSEDNLSVTSHQEEVRSGDDDMKEKRTSAGSQEKMDDSHDSKSDKKSVKTILSQMLSSNKDCSPIQCPWGSGEHYLLPSGVCANIVVLESEPSSIIAFALASQDHQRHLQEKRCTQLLVPPTETSTPSPIHRRKTLSTSSSAEKEHQSDPATSPSHCEIMFSDSTANFSCRIFFAEDFVSLRSQVFPSGEEAFARSLARCVQWAARGGKSGSAFCKTKDDRFVIKQMSKLELTLFLEFAPQYLNYVTTCHEKRQPTLLGKIVGVYTVSCRTSSGTTLKSNLLVMENLFYRRAVTHKYDLKGSVRNRLVNPVGCRDPDIVYLDENLLKMTCDSPLYILPHSQKVLMQAIETDTEFLAAQEVMDYSLLVGLDQDSSELVIGIIDYIRTFTWDKRLENMVKTSVMMGHPGKQPTIIQPKDYRERFIAAMKRYFLPVPDRWYGFS